MDRSSTSNPSDRDLVAEASVWFVEFRENNVSAQTRARFDAWLRRSPEHIEAYLEVSAAWSELPTSDPDGRIDVGALVARARASADDNIIALCASASTLNISVAAEAPPTGLPLSSRFRLTTPALAASLAFLMVLLGVGGWFEFFRADTYSTGVGEQRTIRLADGSTIELNALSKIKVRLSKSTRDIELGAGQALFYVAKDRGRPFIVESGATMVRAVGTRFDVYRKLSETTVTVLEGQVAVLPEGTELQGVPATSVSNSRASAPGAGGAFAEDANFGARATILVSAGEQLTVTPKEVSKRQNADVTAATAWIQRRLIFEATPLADVADEFNRYNTKRLVIADPALRAVGISGVYSSADPASLVGFLRAQPNLHVTETDDEILVTRREKH